MFFGASYMDADWRPQQLFEFGTSAAQAAQVSGWAADPVVAGSETYHWSESPDGISTLRLTVPSDSRGLLFDVQGFKNGVFADMTVGGDAVGAVRFAGYRTSVYVAFPDLLAPATDVPSPPVWQPGRYFPQFGSSDRIHVIRVRSAIEDPPNGGSLPWVRGARPGWESGWRINQSYESMMALTLVGMQGLINRTGSRVYFDWGHSTLASSFWVPLLEEETEVYALDLEALSAYRFLNDRYGHLFNNAVIYDPQVPDTINLATMIAGVDDRLMLAPEQLSLSGIDGSPDDLDLRPLVTQLGWDNPQDGRLKIYAWAYL